MRTLLAALALACVAYAAIRVVPLQDDVGALTYGALAAQRLADEYPTSIDLLTQLNSTTNPGDPVIHSSRKNLLYFRDLLDIFSYAYPNASEEFGGADVWAALRATYNDGYTLIGNFQDLNHSSIQHDARALIIRRNEVLQWRSYFYDNITTYDVGSFWGNASETEIFLRRKHKLSPFFWGNITLLPSLELTGMQNIEALEHALTWRQIIDYPTFIQLPEVWSNATHAVFHAYRKSNRGILGIQTLFPEVYTNTTVATAALKVVSNAYNNLGNLNNIIVRYQFYVQQGRQLPKMRIDIDERWSAMLGWFQQVDWIATLKTVDASIVQS